MFIPYKSDVDVQGTPVSNIFIIGLTCVFFLLSQIGINNNESFALNGLNSNLLLYGFVHADWLHLLGNMLYLWVFGNVICLRVSNITFPSMYFFLVVLSGIVHLLLDGTPAIGASGAVNGIIGLYLFFYPFSKIKCYWLTLWFREYHFYIKAYWLIVFWFILGVIGVFSSYGSIAYTAHIGGFISGLIFGFLMYKHHWVESNKNELNIAEYFKRS